MDKEYVLSCVRSFAEKARQSLDVRQVFLFGLYVKGTAADDSDIDVAVITRSRVDDWLDAAAELYRISGGIELAIEPHLMDYEHDRSGFLAQIRRTGELIYHSEQV